MKEEKNPLDKVYVVVDTNVLVSALLTKNNESAAVRIVEWLYEGPLIPLYNEEIIEEYTDVLGRKKFGFNSTIVIDLISTIQSIGIKIEKAKISDEIFPDPDDMVFYEVRMSMDDSYLITGNIKHFPKKAFVVTPAQMVLILKERGLIK